MPWATLLLVQPCHITQPESWLSLSSPKKIIQWSTESQNKRLGTLPRTPKRQKSGLLPFASVLSSFTSHLKNPQKLQVISPIMNRTASSKLPSTPNTHNILTNNISFWKNIARYYLPISKTLICFQSYS